MKTEIADVNVMKTDFEFKLSMSFGIWNLKICLCLRLLPYDKVIIEE